MSREGHREFIYKILVVGDIGTGKSSFIRRYVQNVFTPGYKATIGVDFALKIVQWDDDRTLRLQLWDIAGQERFGNMTRVYYKDAVGAFVVFDVSRTTTFDAVSKWKHDIDSKVYLADEKPIPVVLLANKCDVKNDVEKTSDDMRQFCQENGFVDWFLTSAKDNVNIDAAANALIRSILERVGTQAEEDAGNDDLIRVESAPEQREKKGGCCGK